MRAVITEDVSGVFKLFRRLKLDKNRFNSIKFSFDSTYGTCSILSRDFETQISLTVTAESDSDESFSIDAAPLFPAFDGYSGDIFFNISQKNIEIRLAGRKYKFGRKATEISEMVYSDEISRVLIDADIFDAMTDMFAPIAFGDGIKASLEGVGYKLDNQSERIYASHYGSSMMHVHSGTQYDIDEPVNVLFPTSFMLVAGKVKSISGFNDLSVDVGISRTAYHVSFGNYAVIGHAVVETFPDFSMDIFSGADFIAKINKTQFFKSLSRTNDNLSFYGGKRIYVKISFVPQDGKIIISDSLESDGLEDVGEFGLIEEIEAVFEDGAEPADIILNPKLTKDTFISFPGEDITLRYGKDILALGATVDMGSFTVDAYAVKVQKK